MFDLTSFKQGEIEAKINDHCNDEMILHFDVEEANISDLITQAFKHECITEISVTKCESNPECLVLHLYKKSICSNKN